MVMCNCKSINKFKVGQKVIAKKLAWSGDGNQTPFHKIDVEGEITSIKGISDKHNSMYKYEFTWHKGRMYTNGNPHNSGEITGKLIPANNK